MSRTNTHTSASNFSIGNQALFLALLWACIGWNSVMPAMAGADPAIAAPPSINDFMTYNVSGEEAGSETQMNVDDYQIGPSNLLDIKVTQDPKLNRTLRVDAIGEIALPLVGEIKAGGLTPRQLEREIARRLDKDYIINPDVTVFVREFTNIKVVVQGNVLRPGIYNMILKPTLLETISLAGGLNERADHTNVKVVRANNVLNNDAVETAEVFNLDHIRAAAIPDPVLYSGDNIFIDEATPIIVEGAVMRPGVLYPRNKTSLLQVISLSGGLRELGDGTSIKVYVPADEGSKLESVYNIEKIRTGKEKDPLMKPGYVVVVEESGGRALLYGIGRFMRGILRFTPIQTPLQ